MSTETQNLTLNQLNEGLLAQWESEGRHFVRLEVKPQELGSLGGSICALRARNIASLVIVSSEVPSTDPVEAASAISVLRDWDQLSLLNLVTLCRTWLPAPIASLLDAEAKIEQMWMREWLTALEDPHIAKVPGLPWRRFIRKIVHENFEYADSLFELSLSEDPEKLSKIQSLSGAFLANKKKVVSIFPKNWSSKQ